MSTTPENTVRIAGITFPTNGSIRLTNIAVPPNPIIFGDTSKAGDTAAMIQLIQSSWVGGGGVFLGNSRTDTERFWTSRCNTKWRDQLTLPEKAYSMGRPDTGLIGTADPVLTFGFLDEQYTAWGTKVVRWINNTLAWAASAEVTLAATATDVITFLNALFIAYGSGYAFRNVLGVWTDVPATPTSYFAVMDNKLWRIGSTIGTLTGGWRMFYSTDGLAWTSGGFLPLNLTVTDLVVWRDAAGALALYALTSDGPYLYDPNNNIFKVSELLIPPVPSPDTMRGVVWRDTKLYVTTGGLSAVALQSGNPIVATPMGLDREDGVPADEQGSIVALASDLNWLIALTSPTDYGGASETMMGGVFAELGSGFGWPGTAAGKPTLRFWQSGWHTQWEPDDSMAANTALDVSSAYGLRRVYWGAGGEMYYMNLPASAYIPRHNPGTIHYQEGPKRHVTPWWEYGTSGQQKVLGHHFLQVANCSATETVTLYYQKDMIDGTWTQLGDVITVDGIIDLSPGATGIQASYARFAIDLAREAGDANDTKSPIVQVFRSEVMRVLPPTFAYGININFTSNRPVEGLTVDDMLDALRDLCDPRVYPGFYSLEYQGKTYYGRISRVNGQEASPDAIAGQGPYLISFIVPYPAD